MADDTVPGSGHPAEMTHEAKSSGIQTRQSPTYVLMVLTAILAVNQLDRHILNISLDAIGREFSLSDAQLGLLSGLLFAAVYVLFGFPAAKLAASFNRRNIVAVSALVWSSLTIATGTAQSFAQLALLRMGVGVGEAGAIGPSQAIISDLYPEDRRTTAMGIYMSGATIGILFAFLIGGVVGQAYGWRWTFVAAGLPGIILAVVLRFTTREPERGGTSADPDVMKSLFTSTVKRIWTDRVLFHIFVGFGISGIVTFGALTWYAAYIIRFHGLNQAQTGIYMACTVGIIATVGSVLTGRFADYLGASDPRRRIHVVIFALLAAKPFAMTFLLADNTVLALGALAVATFFANTMFAPTFALVHNRLDNEMRPMATVVYLFAFNMIGLGLGPALVGIVSDMLVPDVGNRSLAYALVVFNLAGIWGAWHFWKATRLMACPQNAGCSLV
ncbi:MFS transporter [uncultured Roseibium sp.]|uniref:spinster family MFS transporter n=1 Tax=uncultured Roseibium sp. TaxID=1936171 RepID=UPI0032172531